MIARRTVLRGGLAGLATAMMSRLLPGCGSDEPGALAPDAPVRDAAGPDAATAFPPRNIPPAPALRSMIGGLGALGAADANGVRLPAGFTARVIARAGQQVAGTTYTWHTFPDGGSTFATEDGGWIYVSNSEMPVVGGVGAVRFDSGGVIRSARRILERTSLNCAGGKTPWHTWLSCEELDMGQVFECDPWGETPAVARPALGVFKHEGAAVDLVRQHIYLTEDVPDGRLYRFVPDALTPAGHADLGAGRLEVATVGSNMIVTWARVPDPLFTGQVPTRLQVPGSTSFSGGEGIWYHDGMIYFSTKGDNRVWAYEVEDARLSILYDAASTPTPILTGVDNITVSCCGDVLVAEDGGSMDIVAILPGGETKQLVQVVDQTASEITGPAFDPSGTRLYFSSQRAQGTGATYEVTGPFHEPA